MGKKLFATLGMLLFVTPPLVILGTGMQQHPLIWLPLTVFVLLLSLPIRLCRRGRLAILIAGMVGMFVLGVLYGRMQGVGWTVLLPAAIASALLCVHVQALCRAPGEEYLPITWYVGVIAHAVSLFLLRMDMLAPAIPYVQGFSTAYFAYVIFALNEHTVEDGMAGSRKPSQQMRLRNRLRAAILALLLVVLSHLALIKRAYVALLAFIKRALYWLLTLFTPKFESLPPASEGGGMDLGGLAGDVQEPAAIWRILEQALRILALVLAAVLVLILLWKLVKLIRKLLRYLAEQLRLYFNRVNEAYEDTVESLLDIGEMKRVVQEMREKRRQRRESRVDWATLSPRQKVRRVYQLLRKKAGAVPDNQTARTALFSGDMPLRSEDAHLLADLYDAARYSSLDITDAQAEHIKSALQHRK